MNKKAILLTSLALMLAACGTTTPTSGTPAAAVPGVPTAAAAPQSLSAQLGLTRSSVLVLPDVSTLQREAGDTSAGDVVVSYRDLSDVQALATHLNAKVGGVIPELHAALLLLPGNLSGQKVVLSVSSLGGRLSAQLNGHDAQLGPVTDESASLGALGQGAVAALALADSDPLSPKQWWIRQVKVDQVRGIATGKGVIVGVVDEDFDRLHEDLKADGKIVAGLDTTDVSTEKILNPTDPLTSGSHGSGSAGIIAERIGNGVGGAGMAPDAVLMPIRIFNPGFTGDFNVSYGIVWAVNHGAQVLNNSWGGGGYTQVLKDAVDYALLNNVTVVGSAGNDHRDLHNGLEAFPGAISVGASVADDRKADFSNTGPRIDVFAPGDQGLTSEIIETLPSPARESSYALFNGTSMAGPVVAGGAALIIDRAKQLGLTLTPYQIKRLLSDTGDQMNDPATPNVKRLNMVNALNFTASSVPADGGYVQIQVTDLVTGDGIDGTDVILTPLGGQNKGLDYLSQTSNGSSGTDSKGNFSTIFGKDIGLTGVATFVGIEPGDYKVEVAGPGAFGYGGSRTLLTNRITVKAGVGNAVALQYQHQVDTYEYTSKGRNGSPASATDLSGLPGTYFASNPLGGTFDDAYNDPAYKGAPAGTHDEDFYKVLVPAGKTLSVTTYGSKVGSKAVAKVDLVDASGAAIAGATSTASSASSQSDYVAKFAATADTTVFLKFSSGNGSYGLGSWYGSLFSVK